MAFNQQTWVSQVVQMVKNLPAMWETRFNLWVRKISWRKKLQPTLVFLRGEFHGQRSLANYSPQGGKESDMTEWLTHSTNKQSEQSYLRNVRTHLCVLLKKLNSKTADIQPVTISSMAATEVTTITSGNQRHSWAVIVDKDKVIHPALVWIVQLAMKKIQYSFTKKYVWETYVSIKLNGFLYSRTSQEEKRLYSSLRNGEFMQ